MRPALHGHRPQCFLQALDISCYSFAATGRRAAALMSEGGSLLTLSYLGAEKDAVMARYLPAYREANIVDGKGRKFDIPVVVGALAANRDVYSVGMDAQVADIQQCQKDKDQDDAGSGQGLR